MTAYRFSIEWARIEPKPGQFSLAELAHYRRMIDAAFEFGITPVVTLHHFTTPAWFATAGGWTAPDAVSRFAAYVEKATTILDGVEWIVTINEPNMLAMMTMLQEAMRDGRLEQWQSPTVDGEAEQSRIAANLPSPTKEYAAPFIAAHQAAREVLRRRTSAKIGWSIANQALEPTPGNEAKLAEIRVGRGGHLPRGRPRRRFHRRAVVQFAEGRRERRRAASRRTPTTRSPALPTGRTPSVSLCVTRGTSPVCRCW